MLQILPDAVLANDLHNPPLVICVEGVRVEHSDLVLALALGLFFLALHDVELFSPAGGVVESSDKFRLALAQLFLSGRVTQDV